MERKAIALARALEERGLTTSLRGGGVAVRLEGAGEPIRRALLRRRPELLVSLEDGRLLLDIRPLPEEEIEGVAEAVATEIRNVEGFIA